MAVEVKVPSVGESVQEGVIYKWHKQSGDYIDMDDVLVELETDKATVDIVAESSGLLEILKAEGDTVAVGDVIAKIDTSSSKQNGTNAKGSDDKETASDEVVQSSNKQKDTTEKASPNGAESKHAEEGHLSPAVGRLVREHQLDPSKIQASGRGGRLTKSDVLEHIDKGPDTSTTKEQKAPSTPEKTQKSTGGRTERRERLSLLRKKIAERMVSAQQNAAILTTFNEVDMSAVMALRKQYKESFKERHGINLGFMSFFVKAAIEALKEYPAINGWIDGEEIVYHDYYDIGVAVSSNRGLVVPVIRDVDQLDFAGIESTIANYAEKARAGKISVDELTGGTFTISNGGVFGSLMSTPILNPPQSGILGMHKIEQRAVVIDGNIVARPMMYLALSYDHRIVDGKEAVSFLVKIKEGIEDPTRLLLGV